MPSNNDQIEKDLVIGSMNFIPKNLVSHNHISLAVYNYLGLNLGIGTGPFLFQAQTHPVSNIDASFCFKYVKAGAAFKHEYAQTGHLILDRKIRPMCTPAWVHELTWVLIGVLTGIDPIKIQPCLVPTGIGRHDSESTGWNYL